MGTTGGSGKWWKLITLAGNSHYYDAKTARLIAVNDTCLSGAQHAPAEPGRTDSLVNCVRGPCCPVCNTTMPCVFDLLSDPYETTNVAAQHPEVNALLAPILKASNDHYVSGHLPKEQLRRDYIPLNTTTRWGSFVGPCWVRRKS